MAFEAKKESGASCTSFSVCWRMEKYRLELRRQRKKMKSTGPLQ